MYLEKINIKNFRLIKDLTLTFQQGVNILIGENNVGKTTIIDALRICLGYKDQKKDIYITKDDFHICSENPEKLNDIEFLLSFKTKNDDEQGCFMELYNQTSNSFDLNYKFTLKKKHNMEFVSSKRWGGEKEDQHIPSDVFDLFHHVYLGALRDAKRYLKPGKNNQIGNFFSKVELGEEFEKEKMINSLNETIKDEDIFKFIKEAKEKHIDTHLNEITFDNNNININFEFLPQNFDDFVKNFKTILPILNSKQYLELYQNGLGYNNLIYISILLGDLKELNKFHECLYIALLIEEPEAHLHPQLQNLFFEYINKLNEEINSDENQSFQIFISSHSPTLTSKARLDSLITLQNNGNDILPVSLKESNLSNINKDYLYKFLDVTKSQLFFAKSVILVEGPTEQILIPAFAKFLKKDLEKHGVEVVNVNGVAFKHFIPLFSNNLQSLDDDYTTIKKNILSSKCIILTDDDRKEFDGEQSSTFKKILDCEDDNLEIYNATKTFEYELFKENLEDLDLLEKIYRKLHRDLSENFFSELSKGKNKEKVVFDYLKINKKSQFAMELAMELKNVDETKFKVPKYIKDAITNACEKQD
ncbi:MAG: AAA family ATPase [Methanobacteriaceae archaeon]|jgi:putative ATP-dependent endonuclease of OLD family|nr:AAA family ATPase [Methanobacteriaceae archaeon]